MQVGLLLKFLLKALAHPLASFSFHGQFEQVALAGLATPGDPVENAVDLGLVAL